MDIEEEILNKSLLAPRITPEHIESVIDKIQYIRVSKRSTTTVCVLTLINGFEIIGTSSCASIENFDQKLGENISLRNAKEKIWELEGYLLKQKLYEDSK